MKEHEKEEIVLHGFLVQIKARGQMPKKILESYLKLKKDQDPEIVKAKLYEDYLETIKQVKFSNVKRKCDSCNEEILLAKPKGVEMFGSCCPFCMESSIF